jgi:hypothetical protein
MKQDAKRRLQLDDPPEEVSALAVLHESIAIAASENTSDIEYLITRFFRSITQARLNEPERFYYSTVCRSNTIKGTKLTIEVSIRKETQW